MNRKAFIQQASITMMLHPHATQKPKGERVDAAINLAEALWDRLKDRGYGPTTKTSERSSHNYYSELNDQEYFDKCWSRYGKQGCRNKAAKAWIDIPEAEKPKIFPAIPKYLEDIKLSGVTKAHFSTWLNDQRWINYEQEQKKEVKPAYDEKAQTIAGYRNQIALLKDDNPIKHQLQTQLDRILNHDTSND